MNQADPRVLAWKTPRSDRESVIEDIEPHRSQSLEERLADLDVLCRMAMRMLDGFPPDERQRILEYQEPLAPEHEAIWRRLVAQGYGRP